MAADGDEKNIEVFFLVLLLASSSSASSSSVLQEIFRVVLVDRSV